MCYVHVSTERIINARVLQLSHDRMQVLKVVPYNYTPTFTLRSEISAAALCLMVLYLDQIKFNCASVISAGQTKMVFLEVL